MQFRQLFLSIVVCACIPASLAWGQANIQFRGLEFQPTGAASLDVIGGSTLLVASSTAEPFGFSVDLGEAQGGGLGDLAFDPAALPAGLISWSATTSPALPIVPRLEMSWDLAIWSFGGDQSGANTPTVDLHCWRDDALVAAFQLPHHEPYGDTAIAPTAVAAEIVLELSGPGELVSLLAWRIEFPQTVEWFLADGSSVFVDRVDVQPSTDQLMLATREMQEMNMSFHLSSVAPPFTLQDAWLHARSHRIRGVGQATIEAETGGIPCDDCVVIDGLTSSGSDGVQAMFNPREYSFSKTIEYSQPASVGTILAVEAYGEVEGVSETLVGRIEIEQAVGERIMRPDYGGGVRFDLEFRLAGAPVLNLTDHSGTVILPEVDDEVLVAFEHGDARFPYVLGRLWNGTDHPPGSMQPEGEEGVIADELIVRPRAVPAPSRLEFLQLLGTQSQPLLLSAMGGNVRGEAAAGWTAATSLGAASVRRIGDDLLLDSPQGASSSGVRVELEPTSAWHLSSGNLAAPYIPGGAVVSAAVSGRTAPHGKWSTALQAISTSRLLASANRGSFAGTSLQLWLWRQGLPVAGPIDLADDDGVLWLDELPTGHSFFVEADEQRMLWHLPAASQVELTSNPGELLDADVVEFRLASIAKNTDAVLTALELRSTGFGPTLLHNLGLPIATSVRDVVTPTLLARTRPNPLSGGRGRLSFSMPRSGRARVELFDLRGRRIRTLIDRHLNAGTQLWDFEALDARGYPLASGSYLLRVDANGTVGTTKLIILR